MDDRLPIVPERAAQTLIRAPSAAPNAPPQPGAFTAARGAASDGRFSQMWGKISVWMFSVVAVICVPMFPLFVEAIKTKEVKTESYLMTAAVLAVGFGFTAEGFAHRAAYLLLFLLCIGYDFKPETGAAAATETHAGAVAVGVSDMFGLIGWFSNHPALASVLVVAILHAIERFNWHVVLSRKFPDWQK